MFKMQLTSTDGAGQPASNGGPQEDCYDDLIIQSDNEVTPMTDIEDSSGDEVHAEEYLIIQRQSVHDEVKISHDFHPSNPRTTIQVKHAMPDGNRTLSPVVNTAGRNSNSRNNKEKLNVLKRNLERTRNSSPHGESENDGDVDGVHVDEVDDRDGGGGVDDSDGNALEPANSGLLIKKEVCDSDEECGSVIPHHGSDVTKVVSAMGGCNSDVSIMTESCVDMSRNLPFPTQAENPDEHSESDIVQVNMSPATASESVIPYFKPLETDSLSSYPSVIDPGVPLQDEAIGKVVSRQQSSPNRTKQPRKKRCRKTVLKECPVCKKRFSSSDLEQHIRKSHKHACEICGKKIKDFVLFQGHMREHAGEPTPYWCDLCDKRFDHYSRLDKHKRQHSLQGRWECSKCGKVFTHEDKYFSHLKIHEDSNLNKCDLLGKQPALPANLLKHSEEKPIECPVCEKRFNLRHALVYHLRRHTAATVKSAACEICGKVFSQNSTLTVHMNIHTGRKPHVCIFCGKRFSQLSSKTRHEMTHENPSKKSLDSACTKPNSCGVCGMQFLTKGGLRRHRSKKHPDYVAVGKRTYSSLGKTLKSSEHTGTDTTDSIMDKEAPAKSAGNSKKQRKRKPHRHVCEICGKTVKVLALFQGHMREHADEPTPYWCDQCDKRFDHFKMLESHKRWHSLRGRWECSKCGKVFTQHENYFTHLKLHVDSNLNKCEVCGRQYASREYLRKHMVVHLEEKPIECPVCEKRFNFRSTLVYHMRRHTAATLKSATCEICGKVLSQYGALADHMNIHTGRKPHVCIYCGKRFAQLSTKTGHELTHENPNKKSLDAESEEQRTKNILQSFDCDLCLESFTSHELLNGHTQKVHAIIPKQTLTPTLDSGPTKDLPTSKQRSGPTKDLQRSKQRSGPTKDLQRSKQRSGPTKDLQRSKQRSGPTKDLQRSKQRSDPTKDIPTSKRISGPTKDLQMSKERSGPTKDLTTSKQRSSDSKAKNNVNKKKCNICGRLVVELRKHMKFHGEKMYVCRVCGMRFHIACNLKRHMRLHTGEMPYRCKICGERFLKAEALKQHKARHEGKELEKRFECPTCGKKFLDNYHMRRHSVVHKRSAKIFDTDPAPGD
ncbi:zinc finger protein 728-like [Haliotis cracherodii]|uniref:zinc finger protein 728-like n=1 Tax=Haliotis cracherodii TaxID=6455 RepID=UPI0039EC9371